ncbi:MAG: hypothetical protein ABFS56_29805 [Pseudomonadota bacterium]
MRKNLILIIIGMILIPPAFGFEDEYTQFECEKDPVVCLSRAIIKMQEEITALKKVSQAQQEKIDALESKQTDDLFKVSGELDKFYPMVFKAPAWHEGLLSIEIFHGSKKGHLISQFKCDSISRWF